MTTTEIQALFTRLYKYVDDAIAKALRGFKLPAANIAGVIGPGNGGTGNGNGSAKPTGPAGGDLSGTYPDPTVAGLQGFAISENDPTVDQILQYDGSTWTPTDLPDISAAPTGTAGGDLYDTYPNPKVGKIRTLEVTSLPPFDGAVLMWSVSENKLVWSSISVTALSLLLVDDDGAILTDDDGAELVEDS